MYAKNRVKKPYLLIIVMFDWLVGEFLKYVVLGLICI